MASKEASELFGHGPDLAYQVHERLEPHTPAAKF
jgi:hypothetical protein